MEVWRRLHLNHSDIHYCLLVARLCEVLATRSVRLSLMEDAPWRHQQRRIDNYGAARRAREGLNKILISNF